MAEAPPQLLSDSVSITYADIAELLRDMPPEAKQRAKYAAMAFETLFQQLRMAHPRDPAIALGAAFAVFAIAKRLVEIDTDQSKSGSGLIQLLS